jgi:hypothetical protein
LIALTSCLVWVRFGTVGRQLAHVHTQKRENLWVHKWRDNSRRWTGRVYLEGWRILPDEVDLVNPVVQRAIKAATNGRPPCRHQHHFIPQVKTAAPRRAVLA